MPPKVAKIEVDEEEAKLTKKLMEEMELRTLARQDRLMKDTSSKDATTEKQKKVIDALHKENNELVSNLKVMQTEKRCLSDKRQAQRVVQLFEQGDTLDLELAREKQNMADLEEQIQRTSIELDRERKGVKSTDNVSDFRLVEVNQRRDRMLESLKSRLHADQVQLSIVTKHNEDLRSKIALQLKNKTRFNELFEELIHKLNRGKVILIQIAEQSKAVFKKRDEVARKIQALKNKDALDLRKRQEEMQDLEMKLADEKVLSVFKYKVLKARKKLSDSEKATKNANLHRQAQEQDLKVLNATLDKLKEETGLQEAQEICDLLVKQEAENYSLFCYNNEVQYQLEALTETTIELMRKVDDEQELATQFEEDLERMKSVLEKRRTSLEITSTDLNEQLNASFRTFDRLLAKIRGLFDMSSCDMWPLEQLLGDNREVSEFNYRLYLDLVETRLLELMSFISDGEAVDYAPLLAKLSTFITPRPSAGPTLIVTDRKIITRPCPECGDRKIRRNQSSFLERQTDRALI